jgi:hypothetical protein
MDSEPCTAYSPFALMKRFSLALLLLLSWSVAAARILHVDALRGDDSRDGLSPDTAWSTLQHAARQVQAGDVVQIAPGIYAGPVELRAKGEPERPIIFTARDLGRTPRGTSAGRHPSRRSLMPRWANIDPFRA